MQNTTHSLSHLRRWSSKVCLPGVLPVFVGLSEIADVVNNQQVGAATCGRHVAPLLQPLLVILITSILHTHTQQHTCIINSTPVLSITHLYFQQPHMYYQQHTSCIINSTGAFDGVYRLAILQWAKCASPNQFQTVFWVSVNRFITSTTHG